MLKYDCAIKERKRKKKEEGEQGEEAKITQIKEMKVKRKEREDEATMLQLTWKQWTNSHCFSQRFFAEQLNSTLKVIGPSPTLEMSLFPQNRLSYTFKIL